MKAATDKHTWCSVVLTEAAQLITIRWFTTRKEARADRKKNMHLYPDGVHILGRSYHTL